MNPERKKQIIAGVLGVTMVLVLVYQFVIVPGQKSSSSGSSSKPAAATTATKPGASANAPVELKEVNVNVAELFKDIQIVDFNYEVEHIPRDPMTPLVRQLQVEPGTGNELLNVDDSIQGFINQLRLTGILYNARKPMAIVSDQLVSVGHTYENGVRVVEIDRDRVVFEQNNSKIPLKLKEQ